MNTNTVDYRYVAVCCTFSAVSRNSYRNIDVSNLRRFSDPWNLIWKSIFAQSLKLLTILYWSIINLHIPIGFSKKFFSFVNYISCRASHLWKSLLNMDFYRSVIWHILIVIVMNSCVVLYVDVSHISSHGLQVSVLASFKVGQNM